MADSLAALHKGIGTYYSAKVLAHGATPMGVDWSCQPTQELRFIQLLRLCDFSRDFSLNDVGCGYGALLDFMSRRHPRARPDYLGIDLSHAMVDEARARRKSRQRGVFAVGLPSPRTADYSVASGIFNVRIDQPLLLWEQFVETTLEQMAGTSRLGFAVNFLNLLPEGIEGKRELYRTAPQRWRNFCESLGWAVTILDAYGMREFTLLARK